jgi:hypothetical protein
MENEHPFNPYLWGPISITPSHLGFTLHKMKYLLVFYVGVSRSFNFIKVIQKVKTHYDGQKMLLVQMGVVTLTCTIISNNHSLKAVLTLKVQFKKKFMAYFGIFCNIHLNIIVSRKI